MEFSGLERACLLLAQLTINVISRSHREAAEVSKAVIRTKDIGRRNRINEDLAVERYLAARSASSWKGSGFPGTDGIAVIRFPNDVIEIMLDEAILPNLYKVSIEFQPKAKEFTLGTRQKGNM